MGLRCLRLSVTLVAALGTTLNDDECDSWEGGKHDCALHALQTSTARLRKIEPVESQQLSLARSYYGLTMCFKS